MVRRGSTVRVRQRASVKCLQICICCCLLEEQADTIRTHLRYARRTAASSDIPRRIAADAVQAQLSINSLLIGDSRCPRRRESDLLPAERGSVCRAKQAKGVAKGAAGKPAEALSGRGSGAV